MHYPLLLPKAITLIFKVQSEKSICDFSSRHLYQDHLKLKELIHYVNFVADDATPNSLFIDIIKKFTKNDKLLHQVIKLARQNNGTTLKRPWTPLRLISWDRHKFHQLSSIHNQRFTKYGFCNILR